MPLHLEESVIVDDNGTKVTLAEVAGGGAVGGSTGTFSGAVSAGATTVTSAGTSALAVGPNGATNPVLRVDGSTASAATGITVTGAAAAGGVAVVARSSGTDESLKVDAKGAGTITLNGTATGIITTPRSITATSTGAITASGTGGVGYSTGAGGTIAQITNRSTGVTLSKMTGQITTDTTSLAAGVVATFTVTNTLVAATDVIVLNISGATNKETRVSVTTVAAGSFAITMMNNHASVAEVAAATINFAVIKGVAA